MDDQRLLEAFEFTLFLQDLIDIHSVYSKGHCIKALFISYN